MVARNVVQVNRGRHIARLYGYDVIRHWECVVPTIATQTGATQTVS
jgi:hypothetical protein